MSRLVVAAALVVSACGAPAVPPTSNPGRAGHPTTAPPIAGAPASPLEPAIERLVQVRAAELGWTMVPLAQIDCGPRSIAIVWPALDREGVVADDDVVGFAYERTGGAPFLTDDDFDVHWPSPTQCYGEPASIRRTSVGLPRAMIADALVSRLRAYQAAVASRDRARFRDAVMRLAELFTDGSLFEALPDALGDLSRDDIVIVSAIVTPAGISITAREDGDVDEATLPLVPVGHGDLVVIDVDR